ncbi:hypothetical protein WMY93_033338 [Mugilogobius chulae]|uniref:Uncharacterized protein n=1 Tax=Mugilogobius chulae TaxID=88201 RepID=A0AAW0MLH9_9GOBI
MRERRGDREGEEEKRQIERERKKKRGRGRVKQRERDKKNREREREKWEDRRRDPGRRFKLRHNAMMGTKGVLANRESRDVSRWGRVTFGPVASVVEEREREREARPIQLQQANVSTVEEAEPAAASSMMCFTAHSA